MQFSPIRTAIILHRDDSGRAVRRSQLPAQGRRSPRGRAGCPSRPSFWVSICRAARTCCCRSTARASSPSACAICAATLATVLANQNGIGNLITTDEAANSITVELTDPTQLDAARTALQTLQNTIGNSLFARRRRQRTGLQRYRRRQARPSSLTPESINERMSSLVAQSIEVIRKRVDELGTTEPSIQRQGTDRVLVQVPGFEDSTRLKDIISRTARLTFHLVYPGHDRRPGRGPGPACRHHDPAQPGWRPRTAL